jgi:hypothetical protein
MKIKKTDFLANHWFWPAQLGILLFGALKGGSYALIFFVVAVIAIIARFVVDYLQPYEFEITPEAIKSTGRIIPLSGVYEITFEYERLYKQILLFYPDKKVVSVNLGTINKEDAQKMYEYLKEIIRGRETVNQSA